MAVTAVGTQPLGQPPSPFVHLLHSERHRQPGDDRGLLRDALEQNLHLEKKLVFYLLAKVCLVGAAVRGWELLGMWRALWCLSFSSPGH